MIYEAKARPQPLTLQELITRAEALRLNDPDAALNFTARLQREQYGWTRPHAERVAREYTRFLILAAISDRQVTPSEAVDQAWHLHIVYTESYHDWCEALFGRYLHHGPTKGGKAEGERFEGQYEHTLALYERTFGEVAPQDIWPDANLRFDPTEQRVWIPSKKFWILQRNMKSLLLAAASIALLAIASATLGSELVAAMFLPTFAQTSDAMESSSSSLAAWGIVVGIGVLCFAFIILLMRAPQRAAPNRPTHDGSGCSSGIGFTGLDGSGGTHHNRGNNDIADVMGDVDSGGADAGGGGDGGGSGCGGGGCGGGCGS